MSNSPNIFEYSSHRAFLKDAYEAMKRSDRKFSLRYFARMAGFKSHNFLRMVILGQSRLSDRSIRKISAFFKMSREESRFFRSLVLFGQAETSTEKQRFAEELLRSRHYRSTHPLHESQLQFFKHWYFSVVRELVGMPGFREEPDWIARRTIPPISPTEAQHAVQELLKLGLLRRDISGALVQSDSVLATADEVSSAYVSNWHREYIQKAADSIDAIPREMRDISAVSFGVSTGRLEEIKAVIQKFRRDFLEIVSREPSEDELAQVANLAAVPESTVRDALYQLNIQLFPLAAIGPNPLGRRNVK